MSRAQLREPRRKNKRSINTLLNAARRQAVTARSRIFSPDKNVIILQIMTDEKMIISAIQFKTSEDHDSNLNKAYSMAKSAKKKGASLVAFPEFFSHNWFVNKPKRNTKFRDDTLEQRKELTKSLGLFAVISYYEATGGKTFNTTVLLNPKGDVIGKYRKNHLPNLAGFYEREWYKEGDLGLPVFQTDIGKIGILVCSDVMFPACAHILFLKGAEIIVIPRATLKKSSQ